MTDTTTKAEIHCASCDGNLFEFPADPQPDDMVVCQGCRAEWRYADFQSTAKDKTLEAVADGLRDMFKGLGFK